MAEPGATGVRPFREFLIPPAFARRQGPPYNPPMPWMTTEEVAEELGYHPESIRTLMRTGRLVGRHYGRVWLVDPDSVAEFKRRMKAEGFAKHDPRRGKST